MRLVANAFDSVRTIGSWPIRSSKFDGRYLRARTRYSLSGVSELLMKDAAIPSRNRTPKPVSPKTARQFLVDRHRKKQTLKHFAFQVEDWLNVTRTGISLGLLRSRPDPVGEWYVHKPAFQLHHIMFEDKKSNPEGCEIRVEFYHPACMVCPCSDWKKPGNSTRGWSKIPS